MKCEIVVIGDFNAHHKEWLKHPNTNYAGRQAEWFAASHDLTQIINDSTFECQNSSGIRILDLCLTTIPHSKETFVEAGIGNSDHNWVTINISVETPQEFRQQPRLLWHFNEADFDDLRLFFRHFPWESHCLYNNQMTPFSISLRPCYMEWLNIFHHLFPILIPILKSFRKKPPKLQNKTRLHRKYKRNEISFEEYKAVRNTCKKICAKEAKSVDDKKAANASVLKISDRKFY